MVPMMDNAPRGVSSNRLLIVDDEPAIVRLFASILAEVPGIAAVDTVTNGAEAIASFEDHPYALIVMDLHMPVMDGQMAFLRLGERCRERGWAMPVVVFCTGFAAPEAVRDIVNTEGRHCLLTKPVGASVLVDTVTRLLDRAEPDRRRPGDA